MWRNCSNIVTDSPDHEAADIPRLAGRRDSILGPPWLKTKQPMADRQRSPKNFACLPATAAGASSQIGFFKGAPSGPRMGPPSRGRCNAAARGRARLDRARLGYEPAFDQAGKQSRAEGNGRIVEVIAVVVHGCAQFAIAEIDIGPRHLLEHEGEVLRCRCRRLVAVDVGLADEFSRGIADHPSWLGCIDEWGKNQPVVDFGAGTQAFGDANGHA